MSIICSRQKKAISVFKDVRHVTIKVDTVCDKDMIVVWYTTVTAIANRVVVWVRYEVAMKVSLKI